MSATLGATTAVQTRRGVCLYPLAAATKETARRFVRLLDDAVLVGDEIGDGRVFEQLAIALAVGVDRRVCPYEFFVLCAQLLFGDGELLETQRQLVQRGRAARCMIVRGRAGAHGRDARASLRDFVLPEGDRETPSLRRCGARALFRGIRHLLMDEDAEGQERRCGGRLVLIGSYAANQTNAIPGIA